MNIWWGNKMKMYHPTNIVPDIECMKRDTMQKKKEDDFTPEQMPGTERIIYTIGFFLLFAYAGFCLMIDDFYIPGKRNGIHLHGEPVWIICGALLCAAINRLSIIVKLCDKRNNESYYELIARITRIAGWILFVLAIILDLLVFHKGEW